MRNCSGAVYPGAYEDACRSVALLDHVAWMVLEVEGGVVCGRPGEVHVIGPYWDALGAVPAAGEEIECSALGLGAPWRVRRATNLYPGQASRQ